MGVSFPQAGFSIARIKKNCLGESERGVSYLWLFVGALSLSAPALPPSTAPPPSLTLIAFTLLEEGCIGLYLGQMMLLQTFNGGQGLSG